MQNIHTSSVNGFFALSRQFCRRVICDDAIAFPAFLALVGVCAVARFSGFINHDTGWYLYSVEAFLNGGRLYRDVFWEVNPPITLYLTIPPVWLGMIFGGPIPHWFISYVFVLISVSLLLVNHILRFQKDISISARRMVLLLGFLSLAISPGGAFGQREHLMMILIMPYVVLSFLRVSGATCPSLLGVPIGLLGGVGFVLKPYFLLGPIVIELFVLFQRRKLSGIIRSETLGLTIAAGLCGLAVFVFTPEYVNTVVPFALQVYNSAYRNSLLYVLFRLETILLPAILILHLLTRKEQRFPIFADGFLGLAICFFCIYLFQMKGWGYHLYPVSVMLLMALTAMTLGVHTSFFLSVQPPHSQAISDKKFLLMLGLMALMVFLPVPPGGHINSYTRRLIPIVEKHASGKWIYSLSADVGTGFPLVNYARVKWSSRFPALWLLPGLMQARHGKVRTPSTSGSVPLSEIERFSTDAVVSDLTTRPPTLVIVDVRQKKTHFGGVEFDYINYFSSNPRFRKLWTQYEMVADIGDFQVFKRRCPLPCGNSSMSEL